MKVSFTFISNSNTIIYDVILYFWRSYTYLHDEE